MVLRGIDEFLDTETPGRQFGSSDVYDAAKTNWGNLGKGHPGSRSKDISRTTNTGNCEISREEKEDKERKEKKEMET